MASESWLILLATASVSMALCFLLTPLAKRIGLLDHPNERTVHRSATPLVGGLAIYITFVLAVCLATPHGVQALPLLAACGLLLITGMLDDMFELSPLSRIIVQIMACCIMIFVGGVVLTDIGNLMWERPISLGFFGIPLTIFATLGVINAFNMMDGIDGLSSMIFIVAGSAMAALALAKGQVFNADLLIISIGAVLGFFMLNGRLPWNKKARVFLGDSGSTFLGLFLAWQFIDLGNGQRAFAPITAVWLFAIPLLDSIHLIVYRWRTGNSSMKADQFHIHHAFLKAGFSVTQTTLALTALVLFTTVIGVIGHLRDWPEYYMFYGFITFSLFYQYIMHRCWKYGRFLGHDVATELT